MLDRQLQQQLRHGPDAGFGDGPRDHKRLSLPALDRGVHASCGRGLQCVRVEVQVFAASALVADLIHVVEQRHALRANLRYWQRLHHARRVHAHDPAGARLQHVVEVHAAFYNRNTGVVGQVQVVQHAAQGDGLHALDVRDHFGDAAANKPVRDADRGRAYERSVVYRLDVQNVVGLADGQHLMQRRDAGFVHVQRHVGFDNADQFVVAQGVVVRAAAVDFVVAYLRFLFVEAFAQANVFFDFVAVVALRDEVADGLVGPHSQERSVFDRRGLRAEQEVFRGDVLDLNAAVPAGAAQLYVEGFKQRWFGVRADRHGFQHFDVWIIGQCSHVQFGQPLVGFDRVGDVGVKERARYAGFIQQRVFDQVA